MGATQRELGAHNVDWRHWDDFDSVVRGPMPQFAPILERPRTEAFGADGLHWHRPRLGLRRLE